MINKSKVNHDVIEQVITVDNYSHMSQDPVLIDREILHDLIKLMAEKPLKHIKTLFMKRLERCETIQHYRDELLRENNLQEMLSSYDTVITPKWKDTACKKAENGDQIKVRRPVEDIFGLDETE